MSKMEQRDIYGLHVLSAKVAWLIKRRADVVYNEMATKIPAGVLKHGTTSDVLYHHAYQSAMKEVLGGLN